MMKINPLNCKVYLKYVHVLDGERNCLPFLRQSLSGVFRWICCKRKKIGNSISSFVEIFTFWGKITTVKNSLSLLDAALRTPVQPCIYSATWRQTKNVCYKTNYTQNESEDILFVFRDFMFSILFKAGKEEFFVEVFIVNGTYYMIHPYPDHISHFMHLFPYSFEN